MSTQTKLLKEFENYDEAVIEKAYKAFAKQNDKTNGSANGRANGKAKSNGRPNDIQVDPYSTDYNDGAWLRLSIDEVADPGAPLHDGDEGCVSMESMPALERIIAARNFLPVHFLEEGAKIQQAVGRVTLTMPHRGLAAGRGWGTGFMVAPTILMTNNHVIPSKAFSRKVEIQFNYQLDYQGLPQTVDTYQFDADDFFYTNPALDFTLIRVEPKCTRFPIVTARPTLPIRGIRQDEMGSFPLPQPIPTIPTQPLIPPITLPSFCKVAGDIWGYLQLPRIALLSEGQRVNVVQHPRGRRKEVSLHDNELQDIFNNHVRYTSDTEPGSSGSPVFNNKWDLIALHHAGGEQTPAGTWINNQGVRIDKIVRDTRDNVNPDILSELGLT